MRPRRLLALWLALVLLAGACAGDDASIADAFPSTTVAPVPPVVGSEGEPGDGHDTSPPVVDADPDAQGDGRGPTPPPAAEASPPPAPAPSLPAGSAPGGAPASPPAAQPSAPSATLDGGGPPGSFAPAILRPEPARRLVIEVLTQDGARPRQATLDRLVRVLREVSGKPVDLSGGTVGQVRDRWTAADVRAAADADGRIPQGADVAVVRLLWLRGSFDGGHTPGSALGVAVRGDVAAVFPDEIGGRPGVEEAVAVHELGHLMGLVDLFLDTGRADPEHPGHSSNRRSVMYWAVESNLIDSILAGGPPRDFDADDLADLRRIREG